MLLQAVSNQPIVAAIDAEHADFIAYRGQGPYMGSCSSDPQRATHSVLVVGYENRDPANSFWILKNTWGLQWGDKGYFYLPMANPNHVNPCGVLNYLSYPVMDGGGCSGL